MMNVDEIRAIRDWCIQNFQPTGNYLMRVPTATETEVGGVIPDGDTITIDYNGVISAKITEGSGGDAAISITENPDNDEGTYKLDITVGDDTFTTPNLKGINGLNGRDGVNGADGKDGKDGADGADGITPHIDPDTKHWMIGDTDTGIVAEGKGGDDSETAVRIEENPDNSDSVYKLDITFGETTFTTPNLMGGKGEDGRSIKSITKDDNNNIIVTFTDDTVQNIGQLNIDISADFLTLGGFGNLRYYNGHFQYFNRDLQEWIDTAATPENVLVVNMMPNPMRFIMGVYDYKYGHYKLKWEEPQDTVVDGQVLCVVDKVVIRRKAGSVPENENDGELVKVVERRDFGNQKNLWYMDISFTPDMGDVYYYKAFPMGTTGFYNSSSENETDGITARDYYLYGFTIDQNESDPASMISYIEDNKRFRSASMNYVSDRFDYGDWNPEDIFFMDVKPCMLKYSGEVDYFLDADDYSRKKDGSKSDVSDDSYEGNAMVQFPKTFWKIVDNGDDTADIYISDKKVDDKFRCPSHIDNNGNEIDYCYMPAYNGSLVDERLRSLSGNKPAASMDTQTEIDYAKANNLTDDVIWYTEVFSDRMLVNLLLLLIGKSTETQDIFGAGNCKSFVSISKTGVLDAGTMDAKGLFWGNQDVKSGVKVFGMEHWWGNINRRIAGCVNDNGTRKVKLTYGQSDGTTVYGYNLDGSGYITIEGATPSGKNSGYISKMKFDENGLIPVVTGASASTYYTDFFGFDNNMIAYSIVGGETVNLYQSGAFAAYLDTPSSDALWFIAAAVSCKPLT